MRRLFITAAIATAFFVPSSAGPAGAEECMSVPQPLSGPCGTVLGAVNDANATVDCVVGWLTLNPCIPG